jgi:hypothetical protein
MLKPITSPPSNQNSQETFRILQTIERWMEMVDQSEQEKQPLVLTAKDAAEMLQISIPTLRDHFLCRPDFPKIKAGTKFLIPRKALEDWINHQGFEME